MTGVDLATIGVVTVCASSRFYPTARHAAALLGARGLTVFTPRFGYVESGAVVDEATKAWLTRDFLTKIDRSDAVYVIADGGYTGPSVCIEAGYAVGQRKPVVVSQWPDEFAVRALADAVVPVDRLAVWPDV